MVDQRLSLPSTYLEHLSRNYLTPLTSHQSPVVIEGIGNLEFQKSSETNQCHARTRKEKEKNQQPPTTTQATRTITFQNKGTD